MFVSNQASSSLGWSIAAAMSIHNLTEGFMIALPLYFALRSRTAAFGWAALLGGLSQPLGALIGYFLLQSIDKSQENLMFGIVFSLVSGMMTLITVQVSNITGIALLSVYLVFHCRVCFLKPSKLTLNINKSSPSSSWVSFA